MSEGFAPSRRQLFAVGAVAAAALPGASTIASAVAGKPFAMQDLADWKAHVGKEFSVGDSASMKLVAVKAGARQPANLRRGNNFTAIFETERDLTDGNYAVAHSELGQAQLYLQPGTGKRGQKTMRASFS